jgi:hypothetical protein
MAILTTDIIYRLSGGAANTDPLLSLGGAKSTTAASTNIYDDVTSAEATAGDIEYRCVYIHNAHATLTYLGSKVWIQTNTPSADTTVAIGLGTSGLNATEQTVANENTAPTSVTFSSPVDFAGGLLMGDIPAGQHYPVWIRRTVTGAVAVADSFTIRVQGDTNP